MQPNPYAASAIDTGEVQVSRHPPVYCLVLFGISLLLCGLRMPFLALDLVGHGMGYHSAFEPTIIPGILSSASIVIFGCIGNALLLWRFPWGIPIAGCLILSVAASIGVEIWITIISRSLPEYRFTRLNDILSIALPLYRSVLLILYCVALATFAKWSVRSRLLTRKAA